MRKKLILEERPVSQLNSTIGTISDLTQLEELEQNRGRLIESYHTLLQELQTAISLFDENQKLIFFNTAFSRLWQLDESWLNQKPKTMGCFR